MDCPAKRTCMKGLLANHVIYVGKDTSGKEMLLISTARNRKYQLEFW